MSWQADQEHRDELRRQLLATSISWRIAVLAAHPDDESIGASLVLARCPQAIVIYLTDGAPRDTHFWSYGVRGSREDYANLRRFEAGNALAHAGIPEQQIFFLGGMDQEAIFDVPAMTARLSELLRAYRVDAIITHPYEGGHPDHDTAALVASLAVSRLKTDLHLLEMTSYRARGARCVTGEFLNSDRASEIVYEFTEDDRKRKRKMFLAYASQRLVLENFPIDRERLRIAPAYDFSRPPHEGKLWYECMDWPMTGEQWRSLAVAAMAGIQECPCH
jgi:N-acetylglucosamine malate deacetylase 2